MNTEIIFAAIVIGSIVGLLGAVINDHLSGGSEDNSID